MSNPGFLLGETREGFYVPAQIKQAWNAQLKILKEIDRVCSENGLMYFAAWGTLLGALRHGGYIPWDDDMDIIMKREDYMRFLELAPHALPQGYHVQTFRDQDDYWLFMGKVVARNNICFEPKHLKEFNGFPYIACVDIFVLDYVYSDEKDEQKRREDLTFALGVADGIVEGTYSGNKKEELLKRLEDTLYTKITRGKGAIDTGREIYALIEKEFAKVKKEDAVNIVQMFPWGLKSKNAYMPKEIFDNTIRVPFEDMMIPVPEAFDYYGRRCYGNYWEIHKDGGAHEYPFFEGQKENLKKVLDFDLPEYRFDEKSFVQKIDIRNSSSSYTDSYKSLLSECLNGLWQYAQVITDGNYDGTMLEEAQQLAIDMGTLIEQVKGEGTGCVSELEKFCEHVFNLSNGNSASASEIQKCLECVQSRLDSEVLNKKDIVFVVSRACEWERIRDIYEEKSSGTDCDAHIIVIPYYFKDYDGSAKEICFEADEFPSDLKIRDYKTFPLELMYSDEIYFQNGFDDENPIISLSKDYYSDVLFEKTNKLIYVPPMVQDDFTREDGREYKNMDYYVTIPGALNADEIFVDSESIKDMYVEKLTEFSNENYRDIFNSRIKVRGSKESDNTKKDHDKKTMIYVTSLSRFFESDVNALNKTKRSLEIFRQNSDSIETVWMFYPSVDFSERNLETELLSGDLIDELRNLSSEYSDMLQVYPEGEGSERMIDELVDRVDAYYGDVCPILRKMTLNKKPVMIADYMI